MLQSLPSVVSKHLIVEYRASGCFTPDIRNSSQKVVVLNSIIREESDQVIIESRASGSYLPDTRFSII